MTPACASHWRYSQNCTDTTQHRAHNPPLLSFSLPAPSYLLFPTFPAHPSPSPDPQPNSPAADMPSTLLLSDLAEANPGQPDSLTSLHLHTGWQELPEAGGQQRGWNDRAMLNLGRALIPRWRNPSHLCPFWEKRRVSDLGLKQMQVTPA